jgi:hypothetical protein
LYNRYVCLIKEQQWFDRPKYETAHFKKEIAQYSCNYHIVSIFVGIIDGGHNYAVLFAIK